MKRLRTGGLAAMLVMLLPGCGDQTAAKPVIYLYPEEVTEVLAQLDYNGELTVTYPAYEDGWAVTAHPDGTLVDAEGKEYSYLFWEGSSDTEYDFSEGFCVAGKDTAAFLQGTLAEIGLTPREYNEFIVYWLPRMQGNAYNLISFQSDRYTETARLTIEPEQMCIRDSRQAAGLGNDAVRSAHHYLYVVDKAVWLDHTVALIAGGELFNL